MLPRACSTGALGAAGAVLRGALAAGACSVSPPPGATTTGEAGGGAWLALPGVSRPRESGHSQGQGVQGTALYRYFTRGSAPAGCAAAPPSALSPKGPVARKLPTRTSVRKRGVRCVCMVLGLKGVFCGGRYHATGRVYRALFVEPITICWVLQNFHAAIGSTKNRRSRASHRTSAGSGIERWPARLIRRSKASSVHTN